MKFGGSSLADADRIHHVSALIKDQIAAGYRPRAVICSAMGKTTNSLLQQEILHLKDVLILMQFVPFIMQLWMNLT